MTTLAKTNLSSVNKPIDEQTSFATTNHDARVCFDIRAAVCNPESTLAFHDKLESVG
jgi:hypothetical protein